MKKNIIFHITVTTPLILLLFIILAINTASISSAPYVSSRLETVEGDNTTPTYTLVNLICIRNSSLMYYTGSGSSVYHFSHTLIGTTAQYEHTKFEWILQAEGNNQYSIRYASNTNFLLSYTITSNDTATVCIENVPETLQEKHLWTFDYTSDQNIVGNDETTKIKNVANGKYLFARDNQTLELHDINTLIFPSVSQ